MNTRWSSLATTSSTPSSTCLRPIFHWSNTRVAYCSIVSGWVLGKISTTTCAPLRCSSAASSDSSCCVCCASSVFVRSVTRACSGGMATSAWQTPAHAKSANNSIAQPFALSVDSVRHFDSAATPLRSVRTESESKGHFISMRARRGRLRGVEPHGRRRRDRGLIGHAEVGLDLVAERLRGKVLRELADVGVVILHRLHIAVARDGNAVFGALQLRLQGLEHFVG